MGQFSYVCSKCGEHSQFDWITECVVKMGELYVKGQYDGYGGVEVEVVSPSEGAKHRKRSVRAFLEQHREFFNSWDLTKDDLVCSKIYCDGEAGKGYVEQCFAYIRV